MAATRALLRSTWRHSPWGWLLLGVGLGLGVLGFSALIASTGVRTPNFVALLVPWAMWLGWQTVLVLMLGRVGLLHYGLAQQLRLPGLAALTLRLSTAGMLLVFALTALGMMLTVHPDHQGWAWPWAWVLSALTLCMTANGTVHPRGERFFLGSGVVLALLLLAPTVALRKDTQALWLSLAQEHAQPVAWAGWALTVALLSGFLLRARRLQTEGLAGWETQVAMVRRLTAKHAVLPEDTPPTLDDAAARPADLNLFVLPGRNRPSRREWGQGLGHALVFGLYLSFFYKLDVTPLLAFGLCALMALPAPALDAGRLSPRAMLLPGGLYRQHLLRQLLLTSLRRTVPRLMIMGALGGLVLWATTPVNAVELLAIGMAALGGLALTLPMPLCALAWRWAPWASPLASNLGAVSLPMLTVLLWEGAAIWRPLPTAQAWLAWGAVTLVAGVLIGAALAAVARRALQHLDFARMETATSTTSPSTAGP